MKTSVKEITEIDGNTTSYSMKGNKANSQIRVEKDVDLVFMKRKNRGQPHDEVLIMTYLRYKHHKPNEDRISLNDGLLFRKFFGETGSVKYYQILISKQLLNDIFRTLHGEFRNNQELPRR